MIRDKNNIETTALRKSANNNIYLNWTTHAPKKWKIDTLRTLVRRAYDIRSRNEHIQNGLSHIKKVSHEQNQYPFFAMNEVFCEIKRSNSQHLQEKHQKQLPTNSSHEEVPNNKKHFLLLPYKGKRADNIIKSMKKTVYKLLPETVNAQIAYTGRKLSACFQIKDKSKFDHQHDLVYHAKCPSELCDENYIGESGRRIAETVKDHHGRDHKSHILKHSLETGHEHVKTF